VKESQSTALSQQDTKQFLTWENLGTQSPWRAFRQSAVDLLLRPGRFFDKMATSGGLREPLAFYWIVAGAMLLLSFPLALAYFGLVAPDPMSVSIEEYKGYLLTPRITGFLTVLAPVTLALGGILVVLEGSVFHLGARLFGARNWEGSVSIWTYSRGAGMLPLAVGEALACLIAVICYLLTLQWPDSRPGIASVGETCVMVLLGAGMIAGVLMQIVTLFQGCIRSFKLGTAEGVASAIAGLAVLIVIVVGIEIGFTKWGLEGGLITIGSAIALLIIVFFLHFGLKLDRPAAEPGE